MREGCDTVGVATNCVTAMSRRRWSRKRTNQREGARDALVTGAAQNARTHAAPLTDMYPIGYIHARGSRDAGVCSLDGETA